MRRIVVVVTMPTEPDDRHENVAEGVPRPGEVIAGSYHVDRVIGQGGMGVVLAAHHERLGHAVAIKVLYLDSVGDSAAVGRFLREAQAALQIRSEHVARVFDVGALDTGAPYMVLEMLDGTDLEQLVERSGTLALEVAVDYVLQAGEALAEAHRLGIVHRDIKPSNLFLTERADGTPLVKVLDFGIAKRVATTGSEAALTMTGTALGTPAYMAPEQIRNAKGVDARADIWGLGTALYHLLTGGPPFSGQTLPAVCAMIVADPTPSIRRARPELPVAFERVIERCLEKSPTTRYSDLAALARALAPFAPRAAGESVARIGRILSADGAPVAHDAADSREERTVERPPVGAAPAARGADRAPTVEPASVDGSLDATLQKPASTPPARAEAAGPAPGDVPHTGVMTPVGGSAPTLASSASDEAAAGLPAWSGRRLGWTMGVVLLLAAAALVALAIASGPSRPEPPRSSDAPAHATAPARSAGGVGPTADGPANASARALPVASAPNSSSAEPSPGLAWSAAATASVAATVAVPSPSGTRTPSSTATRPKPAPSGTAAPKAPPGPSDEGVLGDRK